ncbi:hypothetical protein [Luteimonas sp. A478]
MNTAFASPSLLQAARSAGMPDRPHRRHRVGPYSLQARSLMAFNHLLDQLHEAPLDDDRIASLGRLLSPDVATVVAPPEIRSRLRDGAAIRLMLGDASWDPADPPVVAARLVSAYLRDHDDLIPDHLPVLGRLDDALLVEAAWPGVDAEVHDYLDYRRLRRLEAELRGCSWAVFCFTRSDWEQARQAETGLLRHLRDVGSRSYLSSSNGYGRFRLN